MSPLEGAALKRFLMEYFRRQLKIKNKQMNRGLLAWHGTENSQVESTGLANGLAKSERGL